MPMKRINVTVKGATKWRTEANNRSPIKVSGGPGRTGRKLPINPRSTSTEPTIIRIVSTMLLSPTFSPVVSFC
jgi:hypothetical protein